MTFGHESKATTMRVKDAKAERTQLLAKALADFPLFCRALVTISTKSGLRSNLVLNPIQARYCRERTPRDVILKARQLGMSTVELARDVWKFLQRGQRVVVVCQTDKNQTYLKKFSSDINRMFDGLRRVGLELNFGVDAVGSWSLPDRDSFLSVIESGASEAAAQKKGRGATFTRVHVTEPAFYEYPELSLNALLEGVSASRDTEVVFESTPNGSGTWFHNLYLNAESGANGYRAHFYAWYDDPTYRVVLDQGDKPEPQNDRERELVTRSGVTPEQLKWYRQKVAEKGQDLVDQEYPSDPQRCFLVSGRTFFDKDATTRLFETEARDPVRIDWHGALRIWREPVPGRQYVISADPSEGTGGDPGAAMVYDRDGSHVATLHGQFPTWDLGTHLAKLGLMYNTALIAVERNNHGHAVIQSLVHGSNYLSVFHGEDKKPGWLTNAVTRQAALDSFEAPHRAGHWKSPDARVLGELRTFIVNRQGKAEAQPGAHDDLVMCAVIGFDVLRRPVRQVPRAQPSFIRA